MNRRDFIRLGLVTGAAVALSPIEKLFAGSSKKIKGLSSETGKSLPDLVGVREGSPEQMFETGIKALGGMSRFVKKGQMVVVKPNIGWNKNPNQGATTNPNLVAKIVELAYAAGASKVIVFDNTCDEMNACYKNSGIKSAVEKYKGTVAPTNSAKYYREVSIPGARHLKKVLVNKYYLDADTVINVPVLKSHGSARMTASLKNLMGVVWNMREYHAKNLHECIAEFPLLRKPTLNVIDAYSVMMKNGPRGFAASDLVIKKMQILSTNMVLADAAAAKILGAPKEDIPHLLHAEKLGHGTTNLKKRNIRRISCKKA